MKRLYSSFLTLTVVVILSLLLPGQAIAGKKKDQTTQARISAVSNDGSTVVNGSVLNPKEDEVNVLLQSLLYVLKKGDLSKLSFVLHSTLDSSKTYSIPKDAISVQRKKVNKKYGKYLVVNLFNLKTPAGISVSPSSLPKDNYKLRILAADLDIASDPINYQTPVLIVGTVDSKSSGLVTVEDENGNNISEHTVATNPNGTFFTEVRANKLITQNESRRFLKSQDTNMGDSTDAASQENNVKINTGYVHVTADKDLYAVVPLDNDAKNNDAKAEKPIEVGEGSTLAAQLAKNNKDLADEVAKDALEAITSEDTGNENLGNEEIDCNIEKFSDRCTNADDIIYTSIGTDFKGFLQSNTCNFQEFNLIKKIILSSPDTTNIYTGKGYCEYFAREINNNKPCEAYSQLLANFKSGSIKQLPCPPESCEEFSNLKLPKCFTNEGFCDENSSNNSLSGSQEICRGPACSKTSTKSCIHHKPIKDLYCARIGTDIDLSECTDDPSSGLPPLGWTVATNSFGNQYCVTSQNQSPVGKNLSQEEIADQCELYACHKNCAKQFGVTQPGSSPVANSEGLNNCHITCEVNAGKYFDCSNPQSKFFSIKCCYNLIPGSGQGSFNNGDLAGQKAPVQQDTRSCLCQKTDNFNEKGFVKDDAQNICKDQCPQGYEKDPNTNTCLPICREGSVRDPSGICRKKCPPGSIQDNFGNCSCPPGQTFGKSGKCESSSCPDYCKNYTLTSLANSNPAAAAFTSLSNSNPPGFSSTNFGTIPPECQRCLGGTVISNCGVDQYSDSTGVCRCNSDSSIATSLGPEGCKKQNNQRYCEAGEVPSVNNCSCASPGYSSTNGPCICPPGYSIAYSALGCGSTTTSNYCSPGITVGTNSCICNPAGGAYNSNGYCTCSTNSGSYTKEYGCGSSQFTCPSPYIKDSAFSSSCTCPQGTPYELGTTCVASCPTGLTPSTVPGTAYSSTRQVCKCSDGSYPTGAGTCLTSTTNYCAPAVTVGTGSPPCVCASGATATGVNGTCQCTNGAGYTAAGCGTTGTRTCAAGEFPSATSCTCASPGYTTGTGTACICPPGYSTAYSSFGCGTIATTNYCSPGITVGTNSCTCNPSGGGYNSNGYCTCPSGSSTAYTAATGCGTSSTQNCSAPYVTNTNNTNGNVPCKCPDGTYYYNNSCVATCPGSLVTGTPTGGCGAGPIPSCLCSGTLQCPGLNGQCSTTSHTCTRYEISSSSNPCTCASGATIGTTGYCQCPAGQVYAQTGCITPTINFSSAILLDNILRVTFSSNVTSEVSCFDLFKGSSTVSYFTVCGTNSTNDLVLSAIASNGGTDKFGVGDPFKLCSSIDRTICSNTIAATDGCTGGKAFNSSTKLCQCPTGQTDVNGICTTPQTLTLTSAQISGSNLTINYSKSGFSECVLLVKGDDNSIILHNGVNAYGNYCNSDGGTITYPLNNYNNITNGYSVKLCKGNGTSTNTNTGLYYPNNCTAPISVTSPPRITLSSVTIKANDGTINFNFTKDTSDCFRLYSSDNTLLDIPNHCFGGGTTALYPFSALNTIPQVGLQYKICYFSEPTVCSNLVSATP